MLVLLILTLKAVSALPAFAAEIFLAQLITATVRRRLQEVVGVSLAFAVLEAQPIATTQVRSQEQDILIMSAASAALVAQPTAII